MRVTPIPRSNWRDRERTQGEPVFCDNWSIEIEVSGFGDLNCDGRAEVVVRLGKGESTLCRECAHQLRDALSESIDMLDARDAYSGGAA